MKGHRHLGHRHQQGHQEDRHRRVRLWRRYWCPVPTPWERLPAGMIKSYAANGHPLIDPDDRQSWPAWLCEVIADVDARTDDADATSDLPVTTEDDAAVREALNGCRLVAYHATRLLPHEPDGIREQGLRVFGRALFDDRINAAFGAGELDAHQRDELLLAHMFAVGEVTKRGKRSGVATTLGVASFDNGGWRLLSTWGGEGIYFSGGALHLQPLLGSLGVPAIIQVRVPIEARAQDQQCWPCLARLMLAEWRGMHAGADLVHPNPIPGRDVLQIWQPGHARYDAIPGLPGS
jgi:hypothetical protein